MPKWVNKLQYNWAQLQLIRTILGNNPIGVIIF